LDSSTPQPEAFVVSQIQTVSSHKLDQPAWAVHLGRHEEPEAPELFDQVLEELGLIPELPTDGDEALWAMARWWAALIVEGKLDPAKGADLIWWRVAMELNYPEQLQGIVDGAICASDWSTEWSISLDHVKSDIIRAASKFLQPDITR
ncbi:hypothetical protein ACFWI9_15075, partial [Streptomyces sp. NPDC127084]